MHFTKASHEKMLQEFIEANKSKFGIFVDNLKAAKQTVSKNLAWSKDNLNKLKLYFEKRVKGNAKIITPFKLVSLALVPLLHLIIF